MKTYQYPYKIFKHQFFNSYKLKKIFQIEKKKFIIIKMFIQ